MKLGPCWAQLGHNLNPSWAKLALDKPQVGRGPPAISGARSSSNQGREVLEQSVRKVLQQSG